MKNKIINLVIAVFIIFGWGGCKKEELGGACKAGFDNVVHNIYPASTYPFTLYNSSQTPNDEEIYYLYPGTGFVQFFIVNKITNICTKEHLKVHYKTRLSDTIQSEYLDIYGEGYWSGYDNFIDMHDGTSEANDTYEMDHEFGLKQAFGDGPGEIKLFLTVEFLSQGSIAADKAYFKRHIAIMAIYCHFSKSSS